MLGNWDKWIIKRFNKVSVVFSLCSVNRLVGTVHDVIWSRFFLSPYLCFNHSCIAVVSRLQFSPLKYYLHTWSDKANGISQVVGLHKEKSLADALLAASPVQLVSPWNALSSSARSHDFTSFPWVSNRAGHDTSLHRTMWQIDSPRFRVGLYILPLRKPCNKDAVDINYSVFQAQERLIVGEKHFGRRRNCQFEL